MQNLLNFLKGRNIYLRKSFPPVSSQNKSEANSYLNNKQEKFRPSQIYTKGKYKGINTRKTRFDNGDYYNEGY